MAPDPEGPDVAWTADQVATAWEEHRTFLFESSRPVSEWLVERIDPRPGQTVLELAAGPGETGFLVAERVGPDGHLISTDLSARMVAAAERGAAERGLDNVEHRVMDAQQLDVPDDSVDGVIMRFGLMLTPDPAQVLREVRRVLREGGRLAYAVWAAPDRNPWLTQLVGAVLQHGHAPPGDPFGPGGVFSLAAEDDNRQLLEAAGFTDWDIEEIPGMFRYDSVDHYWTVQSSVGGPIAVLISSLSADEVAAIRASLESLVVPFKLGDAVEFPTLAIAVTAR